MQIENSDGISTENVPESASDKRSQLVITNNSPWYSGDITCKAMWSTPIQMFVQETKYLDTVGAMMGGETFRLVEAEKIVISMRDT